MDDALTHEQAAERLLEDERLRSDLTDDEAQVVLDWALAQISAAAARGEPLAPAVDRARAIARRVNDLVGARHDLDAASFAANLRTLTGRPPRTGGFWQRWWRRGDAIETLARQRQTLDGPALIRAVLALVPSAGPEAPA